MLSEILSVFFPNKCPVCKDVIDDGEFLCDYCKELIERIPFNKLCTKCGGIKNHCDCKYKVFHFSGIAAPFYNDGIAKQTMYSFKFRRKEYLSRFFAREMALSLKQNFYGVDFDAVTCVPQTLKGKAKRGYNQSALLAFEIAKILNVPFYENLLYCKEKAKPQHKLPFKERAENVKDVYFTKAKLNFKTVLLVDDIMTTGATLDECAKQLLLANVGKVYCVTGTITKKGNKNGNRNRN